ncbi:hypothetical protein ACFQV2_11040 [Actinokineospora soli]|uniref:Uncharacterized protein n=1 Tax=Actinokineospora soli TaxID=1048753 RepID=A0ABW2TLH2_9PSEU
MSTPVLALFKITGAEQTDFDTTATVVVAEGDYFGLISRSDDPVRCDVRPADGEVRTIGASKPSIGRRSRHPVETPWFVGEATITCTGPATLIHPDHYRTADVPGNVMIGLLSAGGVCFAIGALRLWQLRRGVKRGQIQGNR